MLPIHKEINKKLDVFIEKNLKFRPYRIYTLTIYIFEK